MSTMAKKEKDFNQNPASSGTGTDQRIRQKPDSPT